MERGASLYGNAVLFHHNKNHTPSRFHNPGEVVDGRSHVRLRQDDVQLHQEADDRQPRHGHAHHHLEVEEGDLQ